MAWIYSQKTGVMKDRNGEIFAYGYSGHGEGLNNPAMQHHKAEGPIPRGTYDIGPPYDSEKVGKYALRLTPRRTNEMFGRSAFLIHGDNKAMNKTASHGCIILGPWQRRAIVASGDHTLIVVE